MGIEFYICFAFLALLSLVNLVILIGISAFLVRFFESILSKLEPVSKKSDKGLVDIATSQVPYDRMP